MNTRLLIAGIIVLVVGVALVGGGEAGLLTSTSVYRTFNQLGTGEFVSAEIVLNGTSLVDVRSPASDGGLIPATELAAVTPSNIASYAVPANSSVAGTDVYSSLRGGYFYVDFSRTSPSTSVVVALRSAATTGYGLLVLAGFVCAIVGIVLAVLGAIRKGSKKSAAVSDSEYYAKR